MKSKYIYYWVKTRIKIFNLYLVVETNRIIAIWIISIWNKMENETIKSIDKTDTGSL